MSAASHSAPSRLGHQTLHSLHMIESLRTTQSGSRETKTDIPRHSACLGTHAIDCAALLMAMGLLSSVSAPFGGSPEPAPLPPAQSCIPWEAAKAVYSLGSVSQSRTSSSLTNGGCISHKRARVFRWRFRVPQLLTPREALLVSLQTSAQSLSSLA